MPLCNSIKYSDNYSETCGILQQYCRDEPAINHATGAIGDFTADNTITASFKIKKLKSQTGNDGTKKAKMKVPLKYLSNFLKNS